MKLKDFSLLHEDESHYRVGHPKGKSITVPKAGLSQAAHMQIKALSKGGNVDRKTEGMPEQSRFPGNHMNIPKYYDAGEVNSSSMDDSQDSAPPITTPTDPASAMAAGYGEDVNAPKKPNFIDVPEDAQGAAYANAYNSSEMKAAVPEAPKAPSNPELPAAQGPKPASMGTALPANDFEKGYQGKLEGLKGQSDVEANLASQQAQMYQEQAAKIQKMQDESAKIAAQYSQGAQNALKSIQEGKIEPNHYWESKSTPGKVVSAIGLILGGIGGGLLHQENPAMKFLNEQTGRDVEAQKANMGKQESIYSGYMKLLGNEQQATQMATAMQQDIYANMFKSYAASAQNANAKNALLQAAGDLKMNAAGTRTQVAMQQSMMKQMNQQGQSGQGGPDVATRIQFMAPEKDREKLMKDLQDKQNMDNNTKDLINTFDYIAKNNTLLNKLNPQEQSRMSAMLDSKLLKLARESAGRFNMEEIPYMKTQFSKATDNAKSIQVKRQEFINSLMSKANFPSLEPYGGNKKPVFANPTGGYSK